MLYGYGFFLVRCFPAEVILSPYSTFAIKNLTFGFKECSTLYESKDGAAVSILPNREAGTPKLHKKSMCDFILL